ncbi:hypothetical protein WR25_14580 [Diploscapter pachys]|uniref:Uncharacterized protein n=1 Tax=Diploscapter pachys TaxID=2018661 RepID=A0A2A2LRA6_9BILA|nr:hypothetical protein WR25_14580 [Diploscapter pachys]
MAQGKSVPNLEAGSLLDADTSALLTIGRSCELQAYEIEHMFYGYSPRGLADQIYNSNVDAWSEVVGTRMKNPAWLNQMHPKFRDRLNQSELAKILFKAENGYFEKKYNLMTELLVLVLKVPVCVTLPCHELCREKQIEWERTGLPFEEFDASKRCKSLESQIAKLRFDIADLDDKIGELDDCLEVMNAWDQSLEKERNSAKDVHALTKSTEALSISRSADDSENVPPQEIAQID